MTKIEEFRYKLGISQTEFAAMVGVTQPAVVAWENKTSFPSTNKLPKIAKIFGCTIDELYGTANAPSEWRIESQNSGDKRKYIVYRLKNENEPDHSGNREYYGEYGLDRNEKRALAAHLNRKSKL